MKRKLLTTITTLCAILFLQTSCVYCQCLCGSPTNISFDWERYFGSVNGPLPEVGWDVEPIDDATDADDIKDNGLVVVGSKPIGSMLDAFVLKPNTDGTLDWSRTIDVEGRDDQAFAVEETHDGYLIICGSSKNDHLGSFSVDAWVLKLNLSDGSSVWTTTWNQGNGNITEEGKFYGSIPDNNLGNDGKDVAFEIKEDHDNNYVLAGQACNSNNDVPIGTQGDGDAWVFKIDPTTGTIITGGNVVYHGSYTGLDYAQSIAVDCNTAHYIVAGFCSSCENSDLPDNSEGLLLDIAPINFALAAQPYGATGFDHGFFDVIQLQNTFGTCTTGDGYLAIGVQHPIIQNGSCYGANHDFWAVKASASLASDGNFVGLCVNANAGVAHGGALNDLGQSVIQTCNGYLLAGYTTSNNNDQPCPINATEVCEVSCNHYDCGQTPTNDIWFMMVDDYGDKVWEESIGIGKQDYIHSIKRLPDGSFVIVGQRFSIPIKGYDLYVAKIELTACVAPTGLAVTTQGYCGIVSWTMNPCIPSYELQYRKYSSFDPWTTVNNAISPYTIINPGALGGNGYEWRVRAKCSPNIYSTYTSSSSLNFQIPFCEGGVSGQCTCFEQKNNDGQLIGNSRLSIYPNPSNGSFEIMLQLSAATNDACIIEILDQAGKIISSSLAAIENGLLKKQMLFTNLSAGFYWIRITVDKKSYQTKLILQKE